MKAMLKTFDELSNLELYDILRLRSEIFVVEQQSIYNDPDGYDIDAYHLIIEDNDSVVAALRILPEKTRFEVYQSEDLWSKSSIGVKALEETSWKSP